MIDYSVYMMAPSLDEEGAPKAYARAQMRLAGRGGRAESVRTGADARAGDLRQVCAPHRGAHFRYYGRVTSIAHRRTLILQMATDMILRNNL